MSNSAFVPRLDPLRDLLHRGWVKFPFDSQVSAWVSAVVGPALASARDPDLRSRWLRCGGTWFVGVNALNNTPDGSIVAEGVPALDGVAVRFLREYCRGFTLDHGQVSIVYPGYPKQGAEESGAAFQYRLRRHAAHVDGFERVMPERRRRLSELHGFVLGIPLSPAAGFASPLSVWEGSHDVFRSIFRAALEERAPEQWMQVDSTEAYERARSECFRSCARISIEAGPGEAYVVHRLALHGIGPWAGPEEGSPRAVVYFRPEMTGGGLPERWLLDP